MTSSLLLKPPKLLREQQIRVLLIAVDEGPSQRGRSVAGEGQRSWPAEDREGV